MGNYHAGFGSDGEGGDPLADHNEPDAAIAAHCERGLGRVTCGVAKASQSSRVAGYARPLGEQPTRLRILWGESPLSSIARFWTTK